MPDWMNAIETLITVFASIVGAVAGVITIIEAVKKITTDVFPSPQLIWSKFKYASLPPKLESNIEPDKASDALTQAINSYNVKAGATDLAKKAVGFRLAPSYRAMLAMLAFLLLSAVLYTAANLFPDPLPALVFALLALICALFTLIPIALIIFDVYYLDEIGQKLNARNARSESRKANYAMSLSGFQNAISTPDQKYIICDCRPKEKRLKDPIPNTLPLEETTVTELSQQDTTVAIFAISSFGKESFDLIKKLRGKGKDTAFDLGGVRGYSHLYDKAIRAQVYCGHGPILPTKQKHGH